MDEPIENPLKILVIEDDEIDIMSFHRSIKKTSLKFELHVAKHAKDALQKLSENTFDCIFLDYQLPGFDGHELLTKFREMGIKTPVAVMTSHGDEKIAAQMIKSGAFDYFPKSEISPDIISKVILTGIRLGTIELQKQKAEEEILINSSRMQAILESTSSLIFAVDTNLKLLSYNTAFQDFVMHSFGISINVGDSLSELQLEASYKQNLINNIVLCLKEKLIHSAETERTITEKKRYFESTFNPIISSNGVVSGVAVYSQDITEKKQFETELLRARNDAVAATKAKSDFLSNMSHEIRTPMNAIIGLSELLLHENFDGIVLENVKSIKYSADNLLVIINDILDFSKIEAGKITFENVDFNIREKLDELNKTFAYKAKEKNIKLILEIDDKIPEVIVGDPYRLNQILFNLVGNSIKFTSVGHIKLSVITHTISGDKFTLRFCIADTGIGIPKSKQSAIFEGFTQAQTETTRLYGGTGLGLAITKNLTILQGGNIFLESEEGEGTCFTVDLWFTKSKVSVQEISQTKTTTLNADLSNLKILLVEDNIMNQMVAKQFFKKWKNEVALASNGREAIDMLKEQSFDLVLMDLQMPEMSGFQAAEIIRAEHSEVKNPNIPIIALSADAFMETRKKVIEAGMNDFVTKPFNPEELYQKVVHYTNNNKH